MASTQASPQEGNVGLSPKECRIKIAKYGEALSVPTITTEVALDIFTLTYDPALVDSLKIRPVGAACLFVACREGKIFKTLGDVVGPINASVRCTLIALWHVEIHLHNVFPKLPMTVIYRHTDGPLAFSVKGQPKREVWFSFSKDLAWPLLPDFDTFCPCLWDKHNQWMDAKGRVDQKLHIASSGLAKGTQFELASNLYAKVAAFAYTPSLTGINTRGSHIMGPFSNSKPKKYASGSNFGQLIESAPESDLSFTRAYGDTGNTKASTDKSPTHIQWREAGLAMNATGGSQAAQDSVKTESVRRFFTNNTISFPEVKSTSTVVGSIDQEWETVNMETEADDKEWDVVDWESEANTKSSKKPQVTELKNGKGWAGSLGRGFFG